mgnify:CR=1 FL=1
MEIKNKTNILATPNFFSIYCNGILIKSNFFISKIGTPNTLKKAYEDLEKLKWGVFENKEIQNKFDLVLNK